MAEREQLRTPSACKDSANRAKYQRKTCFSLYFRDAAYLRPKVKDTTFLRDNCRIPSDFLSVLSQIGLSPNGIFIFVFKMEVEQHGYCQTVY
jgi:hypothetical protein